MQGFGKPSGSAGSSTGPARPAHSIAPRGAFHSAKPTPSTEPLCRNQPPRPAVEPGLRTSTPHPEFLEQSRWWISACSRICSPGVGQSRLPGQQRASVSTGGPPEHNVPYCYATCSIISGCSCAPDAEPAGKLQIWVPLSPALLLHICTLPALKQPANA